MHLAPFKGSEISAEQEIVLHEATKILWDRGQSLHQIECLLNVSVVIEGGAVATFMAMEYGRFKLALRPLPKMR